MSQIYKATKICNVGLDDLFSYQGRQTDVLKFESNKVNERQVRPPLNISGFGDQKFRAYYQLVSFRSN